MSGTSARVPGMYAQHQAVEVMSEPSSRRAPTRTMMRFSLIAWLATWAVSCA